MQHVKMSEGSGLPLSASFCDSQRTQTSKSVSVLTLRQALQKGKETSNSMAMQEVKGQMHITGKGGGKSG